MIDKVEPKFLSYDEAASFQHKVTKPSLPDPKDVPERVLDAIRPFLLQYGSGGAGSHDAKSLRDAIDRYGHGELIPEWFKSFEGHVDKFTAAKLIYEMFYLAYIDDKPETDKEVTKGELVLRTFLVISVGDFTVEQVVEDRGITQLSRRELPEVIRPYLKNKAITVQVDGHTEDDEGNVYPSGIVEIHFKDVHSKHLVETRLISKYV